MADTIPDQPPAKRPVPKQLTPFTSQSGRLAALKRYSQPPKPQPQPLHYLPDPTQDARLALLDRQIELTRISLEVPDLEPKDRAQLVRALCGLLDQQRIAKGQPLPGSLRPMSARAARRPAWVEPEAAQVQPATPPPAAPACGPDTTSNGGSPLVSSPPDTTSPQVA